MKVPVYINISILLLVGIFAAGAENKILNDAGFPYRIVCKPEWTEEIKVDTLLQLRLSLSGKNTRFQLKKHALDSTYTSEIMQWSRINYAVNSELAKKLGILIFSDTTKAKKLGDLRAFEIGAIYSKTLENKTVVWWGDYSRWTENRGFGYSATVICDTADLNNPATLALYKTMLDSVFIPTDVPTMVYVKPEHLKIGGRGSRGQVMVNDLLGRKLAVPIPFTSALVIKQGVKRVSLQEHLTK
jgi:hypothetical protein